MAPRDNYLNNRPIGFPKGTFLGQPELPLLQKTFKISHLQAKLPNARHSLITPLLLFTSIAARRPSLSWWNTPIKNCNASCYFTVKGTKDRQKVSRQTCEKPLIPTTVSIARKTIIRKSTAFNRWFITRLGCITWPRSTILKTDT